MNELTNVSTTRIARTADLIAAEITNIKEQTKKMVIYNSIEIGRRLIEAKEMISHGDWGKWLENSVSYSQSTANNLMKIFNEYGADQLTFLNDNAKSQALGNLSYTQAVALLGIPADGREEFVKTNDIDAMSTRELQKAIKEKQDLEEKLKEAKDFNIKAHELANLRGEERDEALKTLEIAKNIANEKSEEAKKHYDEKCSAEAERRTTDAVLRETQKDVENLQNALRKQKEKSVADIAALQSFIGEAKEAGNDEEVERLQASLKEIQEDLDSSAQKIDELEAQLKAKPVDVTETIIEKIPEEVERELLELRKKDSQNNDQAVIKFKKNYGELQNTFKSQLELIDEIKDTNPENYLKFKNATLNLIEKMSERL
jgi:hypothetical protein